MTDVTKPEGSEGVGREESDEVTITGNLTLLRSKFIDGIPYGELYGETNFGAISGGDRLTRGDETETYVVLRYDTKTGRIGQPPKNFQLGEFSTLRTNIVNKGKQQEFDKENRRILTTVKGTNYIRLWQVGGMPMPHEYSAALAGEEDELEKEGRKILPERIYPNEPSNIAGIYEPWGESRFVDDAHGDMIMLKTIQKFNELYGPPR
ncbi:MAG: hypothetical protein Q7S60_04335 [bacterium]|nr:hypothetical protein [bacterium]